MTINGSPNSFECKNIIVTFFNNHMPTKDFKNPLAMRKESWGIWIQDHEGKIFSWPWQSILQVVET